MTAEDPEAAHNIAVKFIASGLAPVDKGVDDESLEVEVSLVPRASEAAGCSFWVVLFLGLGTEDVKPDWNGSWVRQARGSY